MEIRGPRIRIRKLKLDDVFEMRKWGYHDNPLLGDYNFPDMNDKELKVWYKLKTIGWHNKYYGIFNEVGSLIGYMGIKNIRRIKRESTLGIVFDPNNVSLGYGTECLLNFLNHYFTKMKMKRMYLEVAEFNKRAYRLYEKMGFKPVGYYLDEFYDQRLDLSNQYYLDEKSSFVITDKKIYNYIYKMKLERNVFFKRQQELIK